MFIVLVETGRGKDSFSYEYHTGTFGSALALTKELACYKEGLRCDNSINYYCISIAYEEPTEVEAN